MDDRDDKAQRQPDGGSDLPAYETSPDQMLSQVRRKSVMFWLLIGSFIAFAVIFALSEAARNDQRQDFRDKLNVTREPAAPRPLRVVPPVSISGQELAGGSESNTYTAPAVTSERMAAAMAEIRDAKTYMDARDWDAAEVRLTKALAIWPEMTLALRLRGVVFTQRGQFDEAAIVLERALKKDPFNAETYNTLATALIQKKQFERAEELLNTALSIRPEYVASHVNLGLLHILTKKYDLALEHLLTALPQMPNNSAVQNNIAICYMRLNRHDEAQIRLEELIRRDPKHVGAYFNLAMTYSLRNDTTNAITWIRNGAAKCSAVDVQRFLTDPDFDSLRSSKEYQSLVRELYPQLPPGPGT